MQENVEAIQLVIYETESLPRGYKALEELGESGLEPLEFYPHAQGVRILFRAPQPSTRALPPEAVSVTVSIATLKAMLSQTGSELRKFLVVVEADDLVKILKLTSDLEKAGAGILEIRSLRSNPRKNYALITVDNKEPVEDLLSGFDHSFLSASSAVLKGFLGFN